MIKRKGLGHRLASIRTPSLRVLDFQQDLKKCKQVLIDESKDAIKNDYAEAIIPGHTGMAGFAAEVDRAVHLPVLDAVASAVKVAEALPDIGLKTNKVLSYQPPGKKAFKGMAEIFQP